MIEWTKAAEGEFERHFDLVRRSFEDMGADPSEVESDLRRHIDEEMETHGVAVVTEEDVRRIMSRMDPMETKVKQQTPSPSWNQVREKESKIGEGPTIGYAIAGIVLPAIVILVEFSSGMCADSFFDPIPTIWHVLFVSFVPISNFLLIFGLQKPMEWNWRLLGWLNGIAIAISLYYSIVFLPLVPIGIIAILLVGYGLLPLAPLMAFLSALWIRGKLRNAIGASSMFRIPGLVGGIVFVLVAFLIVDLPLTFTRMGLNMVASDDAETQKEGIELLRNMGNEKLMLRYCYQRAGSRRTVDFLGSFLAGGDTVGPSDARKAFYRVTGKPFNTFPPPAVGRFGSETFERFDFDSDEGGTVVGGRVSGVSLSNSRIDGSLAPNAALGYLEWTLEFKNSSSWQREARAQIALPAGGVVSRLTLWVHGEEKEAAFASRAKTRAAYESVVRRRRDPVLVTTSGPDRVLVQCFPVPPDGGTMKIRLGITIPLNLIGRDQVVLRLPYFTERNFGIGTDVEHSVWIESKQSLESNSTFLREENPKEELHAVRGILDDATLSGPEGVVRGTREPEVTDVWSPDTITDDGFIVHQTFEEKSIPPPNRVVTVIDGSLNMDSDKGKVIDSLASLPSDIEVGVLIASDAVIEVVTPPTMLTDEDRKELVTDIRKIDFEGGCDNMPGLTAAWDLAAEKENSVILWIHGPQPILFDSVEPLIQRWDRRPGNPSLLEIQSVPGPNEIVRKIDGIPEVDSTDRTSDLETDLKNLFEQWGQVRSKLHPSRDRIEVSTDTVDSSWQQTSSHLVRLWAADQIADIRAATDVDTASTEIELASTYKLVTPMMGAVVLETEQQYQVAGLKVPNAEGVPTIPEPETWMLIVIVSFVLMYALYQSGKIKWLKT